MNASASVAMAARLYQLRTSELRATPNPATNGAPADPVYSRREATMRWTWAALLALGMASAASGQVAWAGASWGTSWEWQAPSAPDRNFLHSSDGAPSAFVAFPVDSETLFRLGAADLPHVSMINGLGWPGRFRAYTAGIDYFTNDHFGQAVLSAGIGTYRRDLKAGSPPAGVEDTKFGWYVGVGEWFSLTRRWRVTTEITMHRTLHDEKPQIFTANAGLAFSW